MNSTRNGHISYHVYPLINNSLKSVKWVRLAAFKRNGVKNVIPFFSDATEPQIPKADFHSIVHYITLV